MMEDDEAPMSLPTIGQRIVVVRKLDGKVKEGYVEAIHPRGVPMELWDVLRWYEPKPSQDAYITRWEKANPSYDRIIIKTDTGHLILPHVCFDPGHRFFCARTI